MVFQITERVLADDTEDLLGPELFSKSSTTRLYAGGLNTGPLLIWAKTAEIQQKGGKNKRRGWGKEVVCSTSQQLHGSHHVSFRSVQL